MSIVLAGSLIEFVSAGTESNKGFTDEEIETILEALPAGMTDYLSKSCDERQATSEDPIKDMIDEGILDVETYAGLKCEHVGMVGLLRSLEEMPEICSEEWKATRTPEQLESLREMGLMC